MTNDQEKHSIALPLEQLGALAADVARDMRIELTPEIRGRFILVRAALFQRGIFDPVLVRFDSATAPRASVEEIAEQLSRVAAALAPSAA